MSQSPTSTCSLDLFRRSRSGSCPTFPRSMATVGDCCAFRRFLPYCRKQGRQISKTSRILNWEQSPAHPSACEGAIANVFRIHGPDNARILPLSSPGKETLVLPYPTGNFGYVGDTRFRFANSRSELASSGCGSRRAWRVSLSSSRATRPQTGAARSNASVNSHDRAATGSSLLQFDDRFRNVGTDVSGTMSSECRQGRRMRPALVNRRPARNGVDFHRRPEREGFLDPTNGIEPLIVMDCNHVTRTEFHVGRVVPPRPFCIWGRDPLTSRKHSTYDGSRNSDLNRFNSAIRTTVELPGNDGSRQNAIACADGRCARSATILPVRNLLPGGARNPSGQHGQTSNLQSCPRE